MSTHHVAGGSQAFFDDVQTCYERFDPATRPGLRLPAAEEIPDDAGEYDRSGLFGEVAFRRYEWEAEYTTDEYLALLSTYSGHRAMDARAREGLYACITGLIGAGSVTKRYLTHLAIMPVRGPA